MINKPTKLKRNAFTVHNFFKTLPSVWKLKKKTIFFLLSVTLIQSRALTPNDSDSILEDPQFEFYEKLKNLRFSFDCSDKAVGFYADQEHDCQIFHMCNGEGKRVPHVCANETSFNQEFRVCDWRHNFECSKAHEW